MPEEFTLRLEGPRLEDTARALEARLRGLRVDFDRYQECFVFHEPSGRAPLLFEIGSNDPPDFAADKALDALEEAGVVQLDGECGMTPEEEAQMRDRLKRLGYIE